MKKPEPEEELKIRDYKALGAFKTSLGWGVKDRAGEWIQSCVTKSMATACFEEDPAAFQLISGVNPWACLDETIVVTLVVRKEKTDVPVAEAVPGTPAD